MSRYSFSLFATADDIFNQFKFQTLGAKTCLEFFLLHLLQRQTTSAREFTLDQEQKDDDGGYSDPMKKSCHNISDGGC